MQADLILVIPCHARRVLEFYPYSQAIIVMESPHEVTYRYVVFPLMVYRNITLRVLDNPDDPLGLSLQVGAGREVMACVKCTRCEVGTGP